MEKNGNYLLENSKTYKSDLSWIDCFYNDAAIRIINDLLTPQIKEEIDREIVRYLSYNHNDDEYTLEVVSKPDAFYMSTNSKP